MEKEYYGYCKEQDKDYNIKIYYVEAKTLNDTNKITYVVNREKVFCEYERKHPCRYQERCEILKQVKEEIKI